MSRHIHRYLEQSKYDSLSKFVAIIMCSVLTIACTLILHTAEPPTSQSVCTVRADPQTLPQECTPAQGQRPASPWPPQDNSKVSLMTSYLLHDINNISVCYMHTAYQMCTDFEDIHVLVLHYYRSWKFIDLSQWMI